METLAEHWNVEKYFLVKPMRSFSRTKTMAIVPSSVSEGSEIRREQKREVLLGEKYAVSYIAFPKARDLLYELV